MLNTKNNWSMSYILLFAATLWCSVSTTQAAPGYTYELIFSDTFGTPNETLDVGHSAINQNGDVVFVTRDSFVLPSTYRIYFAAAGQPPQLVFQAKNVFEAGPDPYFKSTASSGISDDGIVTVPLTWPILDIDGNLIDQEDGYGLYLPGVGFIREIRDFLGSAGSANTNLQLGGRTSFFLAMSPLMMALHSPNRPAA